MVHLQAIARVFGAALRAVGKVLRNVVAISPSSHLIFKRTFRALEPQHAMPVGLAFLEESLCHVRIPRAQRTRLNLEFLHLYSLKAAEMLSSSHKLKGQPRQVENGTKSSRP